MTAAPIRPDAARAETVCPRAAGADKAARTEGKPRLALIDPAFLDALARVLTFGAEKYGANNWRKGLTYGETLDAALRHLNAFNAGEDTDPESGLPHPAHAAANLMFLVAYIGAGRADLDDRPRAAMAKVDGTTPDDFFFATLAATRAVTPPAPRADDFPKATALELCVGDADAGASTN